jgi:hypothetical protein
MRKQAHLPGIAKLLSERAVRVLRCEETLGLGQQRDLRSEPGAEVFQSENARWRVR